MAIAAAAACLIHALASAGCYRQPDYTPLYYSRPTSEPIPAVASISPCTAAVLGGCAVTLSGSGFRPGALATIGGIPAAIESNSGTQIVLIAPQGEQGPADVEVLNVDGTRARVVNGFSYGDPSPVVDCASPDKVSCAGGNEFFVHGSGFCAGAIVLVGGAQCTPVEVLHAGLIRAIAPAAAPGSADIEVRDASGPAAIAPDALFLVDLSGGCCLVSGSVAYEKRQVTPLGLTGSFAREPLPLVELEIHVTDDPVRIVRCWTDDHGRFAALLLPGPAMLARLRANARASVAPPVVSVMVMDNMVDRAVYAMESGEFQVPPGAAVRADLLAPAGAPPIAGAFNILSVCASCARRVRAETGAELPMLRAFWEPGNAWSVWSSAFFNADLGSGPVPVVQVLGGVSGAEEYTDTDEFDDAIIAHEFGHFTQSSLSTDSSPGGRHGGEMLVPNLSFSEGFASWFGCASLGSPHYRDTSGRGEWGYMMLDFSAESVWFQHPVVTGAGSEESVLEILWDMFDGGETPDTDMDGLQAGYGDILACVAGFDPDSDYPSIHTLFREAVNRGVFTDSQVSGLMIFPEEQGIAWPAPQADAFPAVLVPGIAVEGFVDAANPWHPADPSWKFNLAAAAGNPYNPTNGFNSRRYHSFTLATEADVTLTLTVKGTGSWPEDLDLYLMDLRNVEIQRSSTGAGVETISRRLAAGTYIAEVRGFSYLDQNTIRVNAAGYSLRID